MKLYIIRHGETDWNKANRLQGKSDIPLNEKGRQLARITSTALEKIPFTLAYTSPLIRAKETAQIIIGDRLIECIEDERIEEIGFGIYEGTCASKDNKNQIDNNLQKFFNQPDKYEPPRGGESIEQIFIRTRDFMNDMTRRSYLVNKHNNIEEIILVSTHGAAMVALLDSVAPRSKKELWKEGVPRNCQVAILEVIDGSISINSRGDVYY